MPQAVQTVLAAVPLFAGLGRASLAALARCAGRAAYARGSVVIAAGDPVPGVLALCEGAVRLALHDGTREERVLRIATPPQSFYLASAVLDRPAPYQATALSPCEVLVVPRRALQALLERDVPLARALIRELAERELELCAELHAAAFRDSAQRLASYLASLAGASEPGVVRLPCSKTLLAARLGMKKETLSRLLKRFAQGGIIGVSRGTIAILDPAGLSAAGRPQRLAS
ncbi:MAG TPA: Crp/Fnr family transcriptional regulator [Burkholderiales bacterium]